MKEMCRVLKISESGYYRWLKNRSKPAKQQLLLVESNAILAKHEDNDNYGVRRMHTALWQRGVQVSIRTVYRAMKTADFCINAAFRMESQRRIRRFRNRRT